MNAVEFVKKYGWKEAHIYLLNCAMPQDKWFMRRGDLISGQDFDDLKQIVDAFELVDGYGGLAEAKWDLDNPNIDASEAFDLKQAIKLVEQCQ